METSLRKPLLSIVLLCVAMSSVVRCDAVIQPATPAMRKYVSDRFSFWYPAAWTVQREDRIADPTNSGWLRGGRVIQRLTVTNLKPVEDMDYNAVSIEVISVPTGTFTEMGADGANPVGQNMDFSFDPQAQTQAQTQTQAKGDAGATMGGLPIDYGASRHAAEVIVPLDRTHFLSLSTSDPGGNMNHLFVAETIVGAGPHAGKPGAVQAEVVHREALELGVIGHPIGLGYWYTDGEKVYSTHSLGMLQIIPGADPKTMAPVSDAGPGGFFAKDGAHVYTDTGAEIPGADPKTFIVSDTYLAKDAHHTYEWNGNNADLKIDGVVMRK